MISGVPSSTIRGNSSNCLKIAHHEVEEHNTIMALTEITVRSTPSTIDNDVPIVHDPPPHPLMKLIVRMDFKERKLSGTPINMAGLFRAFALIESI